MITKTEHLHCAGHETFLWNVKNARIYFLPTRRPEGTNPRNIVPSGRLVGSIEFPKIVRSIGTPGDIQQ
jgi:hypothetical protein